MNYNNTEKLLRDKTIIFCLLLLLFVLPGCFSKKIKKDVDVKASPSPIVKSPEREQKSIHLKKTQIRSGIGKNQTWILTSRKVNYNESAQTAEAEEVKVDFFDKTGKIVLTLKALGAYVNLKEKSLKFKGAVTAESPQGEKIYIKKLRWDGKKKKLIGEQYIKIMRKYATITARKMTADPNLKDINLSQDVQIVYPNLEKLINF